MKKFYLFRWVEKSILIKYPSSPTVIVSGGYFFIANIRQACIKLKKNEYHWLSLKTILNAERRRTRLISCYYS